MKAYDTLSVAIRDLQQDGYTTDFNVMGTLLPEEFEITGVHRFEGETNPDDESVLYMVESKDGRIKGLFVSAFGTYADNISRELLQKLVIHREKSS